MLGQTVGQTVRRHYMRKIINPTTVRLLPKHLYHMDGLLLLGKMCSRSSGYKIMSVRSHVDFNGFPTDVLPQSF